MGKRPDTLCIRLTEGEQKLYAKVLSYYNAVCVSRSESFKLLLRRLTAEIAKAQETEYIKHSVVEDFDPPMIEHGKQIIEVESEAEYQEAEEIPDDEDITPELY